MKTHLIQGYIAILCSDEIDNMTATANLLRIDLENVKSDEWKQIYVVPAWQVFILSGVYTRKENTVIMRINWVFKFWESVDESDRYYKGMVFNPDDIIEVRVATTGILETVALCGELFNKTP